MVIVIFFLGIIFLFIYLIRDRDKLVLELRRYNSLELRKQRELLLAQEKTITKKKLGIRGEVRKEVKEKVNKLKSRHRQRIKEFRKLKKKGDTKKMQRRLNEWKEAGYNTLVLESKLKGLHTGEMKNLMNKWKKQGYRTK